MYKKFLLLIISAILLISCRRDAGNGVIARIVSGDSSLLVRRVDESTSTGVPGKSVVTTEYEYDALKKLTRLLTNTAYGEKVSRSESLYTRDNTGRITDVEIRSQQLMNGLPYTTPERPAFDTSSTTVAYQNNNGKKIKYVKIIYKAGKNSAIDSVVYGYDNNNHVNNTTSYLLPWAVHQPGDLFIPGLYKTWTFTEKGSLIQIEEYGIRNGSFALQIRYRFEYDDKINPLYRNEDVFLDQWFDLAPNNVVKNNVYIPATGENYNNTALYVYRTDGKPLSATYFSPVVFSNRQSTFYYQ